MSFLFTFKLPVPGLNPFSSPAQSPSEASPDFGYAEPPPVPSRSRPARPNNINQRRPSPSPSPAAPLSRKRGWDPSLAEPSQSAATLASSSGYLDTPAKYREMADEFELEDMAASVSGACSSLSIILFAVAWCVHGPGLPRNTIHTSHYPAPIANEHGGTGAGGVRMDAYFTC